MCRKIAFVMAIAFFLMPDGLCGQTVRISEKLQHAIATSCSICSGKGTAGPAGAFHAGHLLLQRGATDSAYQLLSVIRHGAGRTSREVVLMADFLTAKILYYKNLLQGALPLYTRLLDEKALPPPVVENLLSNTAEIYLELGDAAQALHYFKKWEAAFINTSAPPVTKDILNNMGVCYLHLEQYDTADRYFNRSIAIALQLNDTAALAALYHNIGNQYYNQYRDDKAIRYFKKALQYAVVSGNLDVQQKGYISLAAVAEARRQWEAALGYRKAYESISDSLYNRDRVWKLAEEEKKRALQEKEFKLQLLAGERDRKTLELSRQRWQRNAFIILAISLLFTGALIYVGYRRVKRQNTFIIEQREQLQALNHTKNQLFSVVAHDLRSPVNNLQLKSARLRDALGRNDIPVAVQLSGEIEGITRGTYAMLNNLLYWALSHTGQLHFNSAILEPARIVEQVCYDYEPVAAERNISIVRRLPAGLFFLGDLQTVKVILRNLLDNAIKYADMKTPIVIAAEENGNECLLSVRNKGRSIDERVINTLYQTGNSSIDSSQNTGIGLWLAKTMTEKNGGRLNIQQITEGTLVTIHLPKYVQHEPAVDIDH